MNILGFDHLEFYVGDARQTAYYLCTAFGFRIRGQGGPHTGLAEQHSLLLCHGDIRIVLTTGLVPDHPATRYVGRHGDGVAIIALQTDSVSSTYAEAVGRGATSLSPPTAYDDGGERAIVASVSGFADVTHRLIERDTPAGTFLPGAFDAVATEPVTKQPATTEPATRDRREDDLLEAIDHAAICVPAGELAATSRYYQDVFGFTEIFEEYIDVGGQGMESKVVQSPSREVTFTIIEPDVRRRPGQIDDFLQWHAGAGVQHVAFRTSDIVTAVRAFGARGVHFLTAPTTYYDEIEHRLGKVDLSVADLRDLGILVDSDHWGHMYQIFTESMHVRRTLFVELIERHGASHLRQQQHQGVVRGEGARTRWAEPSGPRTRRSGHRMTTAYDHGRHDNRSQFRAVSVPRNSNDAGGS